MKTVEKKRVIERETPTENHRFVEETPSFESFHQEEETPEFDLFTYDDDLSEEPTSQSFTFETEHKKEEFPISNKPIFTEEKPMEFSFFVNEPIEEPKVEIPQPKAIIKEEPVQQPVAKVEEKVAEPKAFDIEDDFTFINKTPTSDKVVERRNKLKQFNSRYQNFEPENEFESIPAFRRKNISIGHENASDQKISNYLTENDGKMQVRENRFLNKDVD